MLSGAALAQGPDDLIAQLPGFPKHWNQAHLYNQVVRDEYGNGAPAGCVAVAGAACMEWFRHPAAFGERAYVSDKRELRTEALDWARLSPEPLDARGRRTAQTILYNLGLLTQIHYEEGGSSTTPLVNLAAALKAPQTGYASAYYVELGEGTTDADVAAAVWASLRCGSPVAMSIERDGGGHAVVATGCGTAASGAPLTQVFGGYGAAPTWMDVPTEMPIPGGYTYKRLASVVTGIVPDAPEGITSGAALPVLGTVVDAAGSPVPFATVTLSINGQEVAKTATDLQGRYGLWGWFGTPMTVSCDSVSAELPAQQHSGTSSDAVPGLPALRVPIAALRKAIGNCQRQLELPTTLPTPTIHTDFEAAKAAAAEAGNNILCLHSDNPDLKAFFLKQAGTYTLFFADPRLSVPFEAASEHPDATFFAFDTDGTLIGLIAASSVTYDLRVFPEKPDFPPTDLIKDGQADLNASATGINKTIQNKAATVNILENVRLDTLTVGMPLTLKGDYNCTWATLVQNAPITLDGPNLRYVPPKVGDGSGSAFPRDFTVRGGAELHFANGDVSGYGRTTGTLTIGPGGVLCAAKRDTLRRPLVLAGGTVQLGDKDEDFGSLDLFSTPVSVTADSTVEALSGAVDPQLMIRQATTTDPVTFTFKNDARLDVRVPVSAAEGGTLLLTGSGTAAFHDAVGAPTAVDAGVRLEGGTFTGTLTLLSGARLTTDAPIAVSGTFSASGEIVIEGERSGLVIKGLTALPEGATFTTPEGFAVKPTADGLRLVASHATAPALYVDGAPAEALPKTPERNLLVLTSTDRKESGLWEAYATFRSSPKGGGWNVMVAALGNLGEGQSAADYINQAGCSHVLLGLSADELPPLDGTADRLAGFHVGRLPLREILQMGTIVDVGNLGTGAKQSYAERSDAELIDAYVAKLARAGDAFAGGKLSLLGGGYGVPDQYSNNTDFSQWDGLPSIEDTKAWAKPTSSGLTVYALRDRYRLFKGLAPAAFPELTLYDDVTIPLGTAPNGRPYGRGLIGETDGALLWAEDRGRRDRLGTILVGGEKIGTVTAEAITGLYSLVISPSGLSGELSRGEAGPCVGEMLVLNPNGGTLAAILPTESYTPEIGADGIPSGALHEACGAIAEALIADPSLTVGEAFSQAAGDTSLTVLGDPTVRIAPFAEAEGPELTFPEAEAGAAPTLSAEAEATLRAAAVKAGLTGAVEVVARTLSGAARPTAELGDALACFVGLEPVVEEGRLVVAYDFAIAGVQWEGGMVAVRMAVRGREGQAVAFAEGNVYAIVPEGGAHGAVEARAGKAADGSATVRFSPPEAETFLFRVSVSRGE